MSIVKPDELTDKKPEKSLLASMKSKAGRSHGKISTRHQGGGHKRRYRIVDFKQQKFDVAGRIVAIEKDPNRSALIALISYKDGDKKYILASEGMKAGLEILSGENAPIKLGNRTKLKNIPYGTIVCNVELIAGKGGQIARSAGSGIALMAIDGKMAQLKMASNEIRLVSADCYATIGRASNFEHSAETLGKAGRGRWK